MKLKHIAHAISLIGFVGSFASVVYADDTVSSSDQPKTVEKIEVTGSSIKRVQKEGALPVTTLTRTDIDKTGATSVTDLIQMLPAMQGFTVAANSVNGGGAGETTAALHSLNQKYTLVLLNGRRMAPWGVDGSVNLESIPLDAIERVEVLKDGASALYGSDAIAGVVNFILKKNKTDGSVSFTANQPQHSGGSGWNASFSKGFGDLDTDRYNILFTASHDYQDKLDASQRDASKQGAIFPFSFNGQTLEYVNSTNNTLPANVKVAGQLFNPFYAQNGNCGTSFGVPVPNGSSPNGSPMTVCKFNYSATVEDIPKSERSSLFLSGRLKVSDNLTLFTEMMASEYDLTSRYAPPAQPFGITATSYPTLWNTYIAPFLTANKLSATSATVDARLVDAGGRTDDFKTDAQHVVFGFEASAFGWDLSGYYTHSQNEQWDIPKAGYLDGNAFSALINSGGYDPIMPQAGQSAALQKTLLSSSLQTTKQEIDVFSVHGSREIFDLPAGPAALALGADWTKSQFSFNPSAILQGANYYQPNYTDSVIGGGGGALPETTSRDNYGIFGEINIPVLKNLEADISARYDNYGKTNSLYNFNPSPDANGFNDPLGAKDLGNTFADTTYKATFRYTPVDDVLLRASYGTGFRAPGMNDIAAPLTFAGSTSGSYVCPFNTPATCQSPYGTTQTAQYDVVAGGNPNSGDSGLKPEKTTQWTLGFRVDPTKSISIGADLWSVHIKDQILSAGVPEQVAFANPSAYKSLFINPFTDPVGNFQTIAYEEGPINEAEGAYKGIDWDISYRTATPWGRLSGAWTGTYMLKQEYQLTPGVWSSDLSKYGDDQQVVFRTVMNLTASLQSGRWTNTATMHFKSGYQDEQYCGSGIYTLGAGGALNSYNWTTDANGNCNNPVGLEIGYYETYDWQTVYKLSKQLTLTGGINNVFDKKPPQSLQNAGTGNFAGYDGRYADILGRTFYLTGNYKF